jgi:hypothetical protein
LPITSSSTLSSLTAAFLLNDKVGMNGWIDRCR